MTNNQVDMNLGNNIEEDLTLAESVSMPTAGINIPNEQAGDQADEQASEQAGEPAGEQAGEQAGEPAGEHAGEPAGEQASEQDELPPDPMINAGWIGGPCSQDSECDYAGGLCLTDNVYPRGMCTAECARFCPNRDGMPVTYCIDEVLIGSGACVQVCDYAAFTETGCRPGYSCVIRSRFNEPITEEVCLPTEQIEDQEPADPPLVSSVCVTQLAALGMNFEILSHQSEFASNGALCEINDAVRVQSPINGVVYRNIESSSVNTLYGSCNLMLAIYELSSLLQEYGIQEVGHIGTYSCEAISGTNTLSRHSFGDALDIRSFFTSDDQEYNLLQHWEHDTTDFNTERGRILYEIGVQIHERGIFNIVLTPNYNSAQDDHFHLDLTPGASYHGKMDEESNSCGNEGSEE